MTDGGAAHCARAGGAGGLRDGRCRRPRAPVAAPRDLVVEPEQAHGHAGVGLRTLSLDAAAPARVACTRLCSGFWSRGKPHGFSTARRAAPGWLYRAFQSEGRGTVSCVISRSSAPADCSDCICCIYRRSSRSPVLYSDAHTRSVPRTRPFFCLPVTVTPLRGSRSAALQPRCQHSRGAFCTTWHWAPPCRRRRTVSRWGAGLGAKGVCAGVIPAGRPRGKCLHMVLGARGKEGGAHAHADGRRLHAVLLLAAALQPLGAFRGCRRCHTRCLGRGRLRGHTHTGGKHGPASTRANARSDDHITWPAPPPRPGGVPLPQEL